MPSLSSVGQEHVKKKHISVWSVWCHCDLGIHPVKVTKINIKEPLSVEIVVIHSLEINIKEPLSVEIIVIHNSEINIKEPVYVEITVIQSLEDLTLQSLRFCRGRKKHWLLTVHFNKITALYGQLYCHIATCTLITCRDLKKKKKIIIQTTRHDLVNLWNKNKTKCCEKHKKNKMILQNQNLSHHRYNYLNNKALAVSSQTQRSTNTVLHLICSLHLYFPLDSSSHSFSKLPGVPHNISLWLSWLLVVL